MLKNFGKDQFLDQANLYQADLNASWLALVIGNSRLHWGWFAGETLKTWDMPHLSPDLIADLVQHQLHFNQCIDVLEAAHLPLNLLTFLAEIPAHLPLWIASVIPAQTQFWQVYSQSRVITLAQIPLGNVYPTLGIDRALALLGAATHYGLPSLVIDAGTALTFTGVDADRQLVGGAILPGLQLQLRSLAEHTAALPQLAGSGLPLPSRWSTSTVEAIWSGVLHTLSAGIQDFGQAWQQQFADGSIVLTGGDAALFAEILQQQNPSLAAQIHVDSQIIFRGIQAVHQASSLTEST